MSLPSQDQRFVLGSAVWFVALAVAGTSCSESHGGDDDDDDSASGESGIHAVPFGGSLGGKKGAGGDSSTAGSAATGGSDAVGGTTGSGGDATGMGGATGGSGRGGSGTGGDANSGAGASDMTNAGAAGTGECTGSDCPPVSVCGNGALEPGEGCDDGNSLPFDGCSASCQIEPGCSDGSCMGTCGDGIVASGEECDDGNTDDNDGCSASCSVEDGYTCSAAECDMINETCVVRLPAVFRDFNSSLVTGGHADFQPGVNSNGAVQGLVEPTLDADGKPVLSSTASSTVAGGFFHGQSYFAQWFRNDPPASKPISGEIVLFDNGRGGFVNRFGAHGEQWQGPTAQTYCGPTDCSLCAAPGPGETCALCPDITDYFCLLSSTLYDGNPLFFPIDTSPGILTEARSQGKVPPTYGGTGWPWESMVATDLGISTPIPTATAPFPSTTHNFSFTTEVKFWFRYDETTTQSFSFSGDDDAWLFLNGELAGDLGGWHVPLDASVSISAGMVTSTAKLTETGTAKTQSAPVADFGLENGKIYQIALFQAERQVEGSSFKLELSGLDVSRSTCVKQ